MLLDTRNDCFEFLFKSVFKTFKAISGGEQKDAFAGMRKTILHIYTWVLSIGLIYYLWIRFTGSGFPCVLYEKTGLLCPGCGGSRMLSALLRGDFTSAWNFNPLILCLLFFWNLVAVLCFIGKPAFVSKRVFLYGAAFATVAASVCFGVLRNFL